MSMCSVRSLPYGALFGSFGDVGFRRAFSVPLRP